MKKLSFLLFFCFGAKLVFCQNSITELLDWNQTQKLQSITINYITQREGKTSQDQIHYTFTDGITIRMQNSGDFSNGWYTVKLNQTMQPVSVEYQYKSELEKMDFHELYLYQNTKLLYKNLKKNETKTISMNRLTADTVSLMEYLVFMDVQRVQKLKLDTIMIPDGSKFPFLFRFVKEENLSLDGKTYPCLVYEAEMDSFLSSLVKIFYGEAKIWILKEFPHVRLKMDFFKKIILARSFSVIRK